MCWYVYCTKNNEKILIFKVDRKRKNFWFAFTLSPHNIILSQSKYCLLELKIESSVMFSSCWPLGGGVFLLVIWFCLFVFNVTRFGSETSFWNRKLKCKLKHFGVLRTYGDAPWSLSSSHHSSPCPHHRFIAQWAWP